MRLFLAVLFCFFSLVLEAQEELSSYRMLQGAIGKLPVVMHLHKAGHEYDGYYHSTTSLPIRFRGEDTSLKGWIRLEAWQDGKTELFELRAIDKGLSGNWKQEDSRAQATLLTDTQPPLRFSYIYTRGRTALFANLKDSPAASYEEASVWPEGNSSEVSWLQKEIKGESKEATIGQLMLNNKRQFFVEYRKEHVDVSRKEAAESAIGYSREEIARTMVAYRTPRLLVLSHFSYIYLGGAHGIYGTGYSVFDLARQKELTLDDVIGKEAKQLLPELLAKNFRRMNGLKENESLQEGGLFEDTIQPTDNFYLTHHGVIFVYPPYEIASYAMGEVEILVPFKDLEKHLKPGIRSLF